ncbi:MAG: CHAD domain-containing protein [Pseudomonadota bacterium]
MTVQARDLVLEEESDGLTGPLRLVGDATAINRFANDTAYFSVQCKAEKPLRAFSYYDVSDQSLARRGVFLRAVGAGRDPAPGPAPASLFDQAPSVAPNLKKASGQFASRDVSQAASPNGKDRVGALLATAPPLKHIFTIAKQTSWRLASFEAETPFASVTLYLAEALDGARARFGVIDLLDEDPVRRLKRGEQTLRAGGGALTVLGQSLPGYSARILGLDGGLKAANKIVSPADPSAGAMLHAGLCFSANRIAETGRALNSGAPEALRHARVAMRRFRSIERVFRKAAASTALKTLSAEARILAGVLGEARDWDLFLSDTLPAVEDIASAPAGIEKLRARALSLRARAWARVEQTTHEPEFRILPLRILEAAEKLDMSTPAMQARAPDFARRALDRRLEKAREAAADLSVKAPEAGHPLRIELKKMRYASQLFRSQFDPARRKPYMQAMSLMQDSFGALNDAVVAQALSARAAEGAGGAALGASGFVAGYSAARAEHAARAILPAWKAFNDMTPFWRYPEKSAC